MTHEEHGGSEPFYIRQTAEPVAEIILTAVVPGILAGTHAELPIELTETMGEAGVDRFNDDLREMSSAYIVVEIWDAMVASYLEEKAG